MLTYLQYLKNLLLTEYGVPVEVEIPGRDDHAVNRVTSFADWKDSTNVIVNCTGLGSHKLVPDLEVYPTRGQLLVLRNLAVDGITEFFQDNPDGSDLTYFFPHGDHVVLGGCAVDHATGTEANPDIAEAILKRCATVRSSHACFRWRRSRTASGCGLLVPRSESSGRSGTATPWCTTTVTAATA